MRSLPEENVYEAAACDSWSEPLRGAPTLRPITPLPSGQFVRAGRRLLAGALTSVPGTRRAIVSTGRDNRSALALYASFGFHNVRDREVVPGLVITELEMELK